MASDRRVYEVGSSAEGASDRQNVTQHQSGRASRPSAMGSAAGWDAICELGDDVRKMTRSSERVEALLDNILKELQASRVHAAETVRPVVEGRETLLEAVRVGNENTEKIVDAIDRLAVAMENLDR